MSAPRVYCVCRQSPVYTPARVEWLRRQIKDAELFVMGDYPGANMPLLFEWPGWWSKLELCRPDIPGDVFYMDLDTVPLGPIAEFARERPTTFLSDFYRPAQLQSSVVYLTAADRARIWERWIGNPGEVMRQYRTRGAGFNGDQNFMEEVLGQGVARWQDTPDLTPVCSYKVDMVGKGHVPLTGGLIVFHGKPRPWDVPGATWNR